MSFGRVAQRWKLQWAGGVKKTRSGELQMWSTAISTNASDEQFDITPVCAFL
jgi:hypothetical protein